MTTKAFKTWTERLDSGTLSKSEIAQFAAAVVPIAQGYDAGGRRTNLTQPEAQQLRDRLRTVPVYLTDSHTEQGATWLRKHGRKVLGLTDEMAEAVAEEDFIFLWNGYVVDGCTRHPVWTVVFEDGRQFRYWYAPWVSGEDLSGWESSDFR